MQVSEKSDIVGEMRRIVGGPRLIRAENRGRGVKIWISRILPHELDKIFNYIRFQYIDLELGGSSEGVVLYFTSKRGRRLKDTSLL